MLNSRSPPKVFVKLSGCASLKILMAQSVRSYKKQPLQRSLFRFSAMMLPNLKNGVKYLLAL